MSYAATAVRKPNIHHQQRRRPFEENSFGQALCTLRFRVIEQRLVIPAFGLPFFNGFGADALPTDRHSSHVIGRIDRKKQDEGKKIDANQNENTVDQASEDIPAHGPAPCDRAARSVSLSLRLMMRMAGYTPAATKASSTHSGHQTGAFQALMRSARMSASMRRYCKVLRTICVGLALATHD